jgi:multidrug efflux pump subunit AcrB
MYDEGVSPRALRNTAWVILMMAIFATVAAIVLKGQYAYGTFSLPSDASRFLGAIWVAASLSFQRLRREAKRIEKSQIQRAEEQKERKEE